MGVEKISRTILTLPFSKLSLKLHIKLMNENHQGELEGFHKEFTFNGKEYLSLNVFPILTLEMMDKTDGWKPDKTIILTQRNIFYLIQSLKKINKAIYKEDMFVYDERNELMVYKDMAEKHTERVYKLGNHKLLLKPSVVYSPQEEAYEGIVMYFNNTNNVVQVNLDDLNALIYTLDKIDLFTYSQHMLNYYVYSMNNPDKIQKEKSKKTVNIIDFKPEPEVKDSMKKDVSPTDFFGIKS